jgi:O-antigen/teichoic acid export membrane protein
LFKSQLKMLTKYGMPRMIGDFFLFSFWAFPLIYLNQHLDIRATSYFSVGLTLLGMLTPVFSMLGMVLLPWVSSAMAGDRFPQAEKLMGKLMWIFPVLAAVAALLVGWGMELFIRLFFDAAFLPAVTIARILLFSLVFESIYLLLRNPIDAISTRPYNTWNMLMSLVVLVGLFAVGRTLTDFAYAFLAATVLKAALSMATWQKCRKNRE